LNGWTTVAELPPETTQFTDVGALDPATSPPYSDTPPCGRPDGPRRYEYRVYGVDTGGRAAPDDPGHEARTTVTLGGVTPTTKVLVPSVTGLSLTDAQSVLDATKTDPLRPGTCPAWAGSSSETVDGSVTPGTVLTARPRAGD
jgi:hypothetical protein